MPCTSPGRGCRVVVVTTGANTDGHRATSVCARVVLPPQVGPHRAITPTVETVFEVMGCLSPLPWGSNRTVARIRHPTTARASGGDTDALIARLRVLPRR